MLKRPLFLPVLIIPFIINSCNNELDVLDDYEEKIVIFGILNPNDTAHYVRVGRVFLGEGNALLFAQTEDSIQLPPEQMEVRITRLQNGVEQQFWILQPDTSQPREEGVFLWPHQVVYRGAFPVLTDGSTYRITVTNLRTGYVASSETEVVKDLAHTNPSSAVPLNLQEEANIRFYFSTPLYGKRYQLMLRFYYDEQFIYDTTQVSTRYVDWIIGETESLDDRGGENLSIGVNRRNFLHMLSNKIEENTFVRRISRKVELIYTSAHEDFVTFIHVQEAINTSSADLPQFSNVENGLGIFSTRNTTVYPNYSLDLDTREALVSDPLLDDLNFVR